MKPVREMKELPIPGPKYPASILSQFIDPISAAVDGGALSFWVSLWSGIAAARVHIRVWGSHEGVALAVSWSQAVVSVAVVVAASGRNALT